MWYSVAEDDLEPDEDEDDNLPEVDEEDEDGGDYGVAQYIDDDEEGARAFKEDEDGNVIE